MGLNLEKLLGSLGMISSAGKLVYGEKLLEQIRNNKIKIVLTTSDMGKAQLKKINDKSTFYNVRIINNLFDSETLNKAIGRKNVKSIGVSDENFVKLLLKNIE
ncbi:L7Ae/L30e/S12e/Gadd45 family ribosomal protein [Spiroplasma diminutum]|uniref:Putative 50S ribosomal protein L7Ae n=1 Tax=Spiroplasma diminutum CUAS-1 TaxID=1276221 RepID=S5M1T5_9MOLU|nr:50S ribosomal protein L7ae [Spiroplasma diminutum]AGR42032.1 putative 50S ribosomal protein L7Ae [Spiroplasma diminutum CUAS-1]